MVTSEADPARSAAGDADRGAPAKDVAADATVIAGGAAACVAIAAVCVTAFGDPPTAAVWFLPLGIIATVLGPLSAAIGGIYVFARRRLPGGPGSAAGVQRERPPLWRRVGVGATIAGVLVLVAFGILNNREITTVPDVHGLSLPAARDALDNAGVLIAADGVERKRAHETRGRVIGQEPSPGEHVQGPITGSLVVSRGLRVPRVVGSAHPEAAQQLRKAGLRIGAASSEFASTRQPRDTIIEQDPRAGADATPGSAVDIVLSQGIRIPNVVGRAVNAAQRMLRSAGFEVVSQRQFDATPEGLVVAQEPGGGDGLDFGARITLIESRGPEPRGRILGLRAGSSVPITYRVRVRLRPDQLRSGSHFWLAVDAPSGLIPKSTNEQELPRRVTSGKLISETGQGLPSPRYDLVLISVDSTGNQRIRRWFATGRRTGRYPAFTGPGTDGLGAGRLSGLQVLARVRNLQINQ